jgi:ligand-binding sensor domain-containing protein/AraC-like DNA-binding protein
MTCLYSVLQAKSSQDYLIRTWNIQSGLKHNTVTALHQSSIGYIWIGTPAGLVRFDGIRFTHFNRWNTPAMQNEYITCLFEDLYGNLWIGTDGGGLLRYAQGIWQHFSTKNGLSDNFIRAICDDWQGNLWVGTDNGLNSYDQDGWKTITLADGLYDNTITSLELDRTGNLWIGTFRNGFAHYNEGIIRIYGYEDGLSNLSVSSLKSDPLGNLWIGTLEGLFVLNRKPDQIRYYEGSAYTPVTDLLLDNKTNLWIATMVDGLKQSKTFFTDLSGAATVLSDEYIRCLLRDHNGHLWMGTDNLGLIQLKKPTVSVITREDGLPENNVSTVLLDRYGNLWTGFNTSGIFCIRSNGETETYTVQDGLASNHIRALAEDPTGTIWIGTQGVGLHYLAENQIKQIDINQDINSITVTALLADKENTLWVGTDLGLYHYDQKKLNRASLPHAENISPIHVLYSGPSEILYVVSGKNIFIYEEFKFKKILSTPSDICCLYEDRNGTLWIGTREDGIMRWLDKVLASLSVENGLPHQNILSIVEDHYGNFWLSSPRGIIRISVSDLDDFFNQRQNIVVAAVFDEADGMVNSRCSSGTSPVISYTPSMNNLYYATAGGLVIVDINRIQQYDLLSTPHPLIEEITTEEVIKKIDSQQETKSSSNKIEFRFTAFDYSAGEKLYFRYKLAGYDTTHTSVFPGQERTASYHDIPAGDYYFEVQAANQFAGWGNPAKSMKIIITRPFYTYIYFYLPIAGLITMIITSFFYVRRRKYIQQQTEKYKTVIIPADTAESTISKIRQLMEVEKIYLDRDLTLAVLARHLHIHSNQLSRIINEQFELNFNDYINKYRIQEARQILVAPENRDKTIQEILYESGFYSKSVFNTAFKKITGQTPTHYRNTHIKDAHSNQR